MRKYRVTLGTKTILFRELKLGEWGSLTKLRNGHLSLYGSVVEYALLEPSYSDLAPGEILYLGEQIYNLSCKFSNDELDTSISSKIKTIEESVDMIPVIICSVFPAYTPEMVLDFDFDTLVTRLAQVKWMNERNTPEQIPEGANPLQMKSIENSRTALADALKSAQSKRGRV